MGLENFTSEQVAEIVRMASLTDKARIFEGGTQRPFGVQSLTIDLGTVRLETNPFKIGFPFKSVYISAATDVLANINLKPQSSDSYQSYVPLKQNDSLAFGYSQSKADLFWSAQTGKTITLIFFVDADFKSGSQISVTGGGVSIVDGSSFTITNTLLVAATITSILSSDITRKKASIQNNSGDYMYFGTSTVSSVVSSANRGFEVAPGDTFVWQNTAALWVICPTSNYIHIFQEF